MLKKSTPFFAVFIFILANSSIISNSYANTPPTNFKIHVTAKPATYNAKDVNVTLTKLNDDGSDGTAKTEKTNASGFVDFVATDSGRYRLDASFNGYNSATKLLDLEKKQLNQILILKSLATYTVNFKVLGASDKVNIVGEERIQGLQFSGEIPANTTGTFPLNEGNWNIHANTPDRLPVVISLSVGPQFDDQGKQLPISPVDLTLNFQRQDPTPIESEKNLTCSSPGNSNNHAVPLSFLTLLLGIVFSQAKSRKKRLS